MNNFYLRFLSTLFFAPLIIIATYMGGWYFKILLFAVFILGLYEIIKLKNYTIRIIIFLLFILFFISIYKIRFLNNGFDYILFCLFLTWLSDIGGYIFGKVIGGKKINFISPNKTYSGFFGSLILPQILILYLIKYNILQNNNFYFLIFLVLILSISAIIGDLFFSQIKRILKIKDYSKLIPGHGGIFDRIDSLLFVVIIFYIYI